MYIGQFFILLSRYICVPKRYYARRSFVEENLITLAAEEGIWVLLSIALLMYILKKQEKRDSAQAEREKRYQTLLMELSEKFESVSSIKDNVLEIREIIEKNKD